MLEENLTPSQEAALFDSDLAVRLVERALRHIRSFVPCTQHPPARHFSAKNRLDWEWQ